MIRTVLFFWFASAVFAADAGHPAVLWGDAANGLRLGLKMGAVASGEVRVVFQNAGPAPVHILLGEECGGRAYHLKFAAKRVKFTATPADRLECDLIDDRATGICAGMMKLIVADLAPKQTTELGFDAKKLVCGRQDSRSTLEDLRQHGYRLSVVFEGVRSASPMGSNGLRDAWVGRIEAGSN